MVSLSSHCLLLFPPIFSSSLLFWANGHTESSRNTDNNTLALQLLGEVDLVAGGVLDEDIQVGDSVSLLDECGRSLVEERGLGANARNASSETTSGKHCGRIGGIEIEQSEVLKNSKNSERGKKGSDGAPGISSWPASAPASAPAPIFIRALTITHNSLLSSMPSMPPTNHKGPL